MPGFGLTSPTLIIVSFKPSKYATSDLKLKINTNENVMVYIHAKKLFLLDLLVFV